MERRGCICLSGLLKKRARAVGELSVLVAPRKGHPRECVFWGGRGRCLRRCFQRACTAVPLCVSLARVKKKKGRAGCDLGIVKGRAPGPPTRREGQNEEDRWQREGYGFFVAAEAGGRAKARPSRPKNACRGRGAAPRGGSHHQDSVSTVVGEEGQKAPGAMRAAAGLLAGCNCCCQGHKRNEKGIWGEGPLRRRGGAENKRPPHMG